MGFLQAHKTCKWKEKKNPFGCNLLESCLLLENVWERWVCKGYENEVRTKGLCIPVLGKFKGTSAPWYLHCWWWLSTHTAKETAALAHMILGIKITQKPLWFPLISLPTMPSTPSWYSLCSQHLHNFKKSYHRKLAAGGQGHASCKTLNHCLIH